MTEALMEPTFPTVVEPKLGIELECFEDVKYETLKWLFRGRIPLGKFSLIGGNAGVGKSVVSVDLAARVTRGDYWIGTPEKRQDPADVIMLGCEDSNADTVKPRLRAHGADMRRVFAMKGIRLIEEPRHLNMISLDRDVHQLENMLKARPETKLIVIDPLSSYFGKGVKMNEDGDVRRVLSPLAELAEEYRVGILGLAHLNKSTLQQAVHRIGGSVALTAFSRMAWAVAFDPQDPTHQKRVFGRLKGNNTKDSGGLKFDLDSVTIPEVAESQPCVRWGAEVFNIDIEELLSPPRGRPKGVGADAVAWLKEYLDGGPIRQTIAQKAADDEDFSRRTMTRARAELSMRSKTRTVAGVEDLFWWLPKDDEK